MTINRAPRRIHALAMLPLFVLLVAARTSVAPLPETMVAAKADVAMNELITVKQGDVILRANVFDTEVVTLSEPVSVGIAKFSQDIPAGTRLDPVLVSERTEQLTGSGGRIYCGENQRTRSKFGEAMIGDWFSKYETIVRFCFIDSNDDKKLDKVFLAGAKAKEDQLAIAITPAAFERRLFEVDDEAGVLELRVHRLIAKKSEPDKVEFKLHLMKNGVEQPFDFIRTVEKGVPESTIRFPAPTPKNGALPIVLQRHSRRRRGGDGGRCRQGPGADQGAQQLQDAAL
ncbi:MAG: hypothetical protein HC870_02080 [Rhizobiales bacterium]|nr:hypothetical protein [Hyphomicrobiales bacterium]